MLPTSAANFANRLSSGFLLYSGPGIDEQGRLLTVEEGDVIAYSTTGARSVLLEGDFDEVAGVDAGWFAMAVGATTTELGAVHRSKSGKPTARLEGARFLCEGSKLTVCDLDDGRSYRLDPRELGFSGIVHAFP